jgi:hypothetical protein
MPRFLFNISKDPIRWYEGMASNGEHQFHFTTSLCFGTDISHRQHIPVTVEFLFCPPHPTAIRRIVFLLVKLVFISLS